MSDSTKTTAKETPRPWLVRKFPASGTWVLDSIPDRDGKVVANIIVSPQTTNPHYEGNAALIVRAVNAHDAIVAAAEAIYEELDDQYDGAPDSTTLWMGRHLDALRDALAKATGAAAATE